MKFLLDENVHIGLLSFLTGLKHDVILCPKGIKNGELYKLILQEERTLITNDADFIKQPYRSSHHFGIILLRIHPFDIEKQKTSVLNLINKSGEKEIFRNKTIILYSEKNIEVL